ncbi:MAG: ribonuclease Z [Thermomicrobiales bacterium]|nr:ribonuclease Z [Thermomicrobiales bacterium]
MPLPGRPLSTCLIRVNGETILWDCGEGTQVNWRASGWPFRSTGTILLSHLHADHVAGLPGILFQIAHSGRREPVTIYGPPRTHEVVQHLFSIVGRVPYELGVAELEGGETFDLPGGVSASCILTQHHMPCLAYRLDVSRGRRFDADRARRLNIPIEHWSRLQAGESVDGATPDDVLGPPRRGLGLSLVTDTAIFDELTPFVADSDLLVCEAMYADDDLTERARQRGHMTARQAARLAADAEVRALWLTHLSPAVADPASVAAVASQEYPGAIVGTPGLTTTLSFDDA